MEEFTRSNSFSVWKQRCCRRISTTIFTWCDLSSAPTTKTKRFRFSFPKKYGNNLYENLLVVLGAFVWFFEPSTHTIFHREETNLSDTMKYSALSSSFRISLSINTSTQVLIYQQRYLRGLWSTLYRVLKIILGGGCTFWFATFGICSCLWNHSYSIEATSHKTRLRGAIWGLSEVFG